MIRGMPAQPKLHSETQSQVNKVRVGGSRGVDNTWKDSLASSSQSGNFFTSNLYFFFSVKFINTWSQYARKTV